MKKKIILFITVLSLTFVFLAAAPTLSLPASDALFSVCAVSSYDSLAELYKSIPTRDKWASLYVDTTNLSYWYNQAELIFANPSWYNDAYINNVVMGLSEAYGALELKATGISVDKKSLTLNVGAKATLKATLTPADAKGTIVWKSSDAKHVSVTNAGVVTALKYTDSAVTLTASCNGHEAKCKVTVTNPIDKLKLNADTKVTYTGRTFTLKPTATGVDEESPISYGVVYTWDSSDENVCVVNDDGKVTAVGEGVATVICTAKAGATKKATCTVSVEKLVEVAGLIPQFTTVDGAVTMVVGETETLSVNITPQTATIKLLTWTSSNPEILKVVSSGTSSSTSTARLQAIKTGKVTLKYKATDGSGKSGSLIVNVKPKITKISVSPSRVVITPGNSRTLSSSVSPSNAGNQVLEWSSSDTNVASVNSAGKITAKNRGTCVITAGTTDGSKLSDTCAVRVSPSSSSIKLSKTSAVVNVGSKLTLVPTVTTSIGTTYNDFVSFSSSDTSVAKVSSEGAVTGIAPGSVKITATTLDGKKLSATASIRVLQPVKGISCKASKSMEKNSSFRLNVTVSPSNATDKRVTYSSSDPTIAAVTDSGLVRSFSKEGTCTITAKSVDGGFTAKCVVTVRTATTGIKLNAAKKTISAGEKFTLKATVTPADATNKTVKWSSSNKKVATVKAGVITAVAGGSCTITAKASGGQKATCTVSVKQALETLSLKKTAVKLYKGQVYTLRKIVTPSTATVKKYTWKSSDAAVAAVDSTGKVTAKGIGYCVVTVSAGGKTASCAVTVTDAVKVKGLAIEPAYVSVASGKTATVKAVFTPKNASNKSVTWASSNKNVATVSDKGVITGVNGGSCVITAKSKDGGYIARCSVKVDIPVTAIRFKKESVTCNLGSKLRLNCTVYPSDASDKTLIWSSSNINVATVSASGYVKGLKTGKATITAKTPDGKFSASIVVNVLVKVTGIKLDKSAVTLQKGDTYGLVFGISPKNATNKKLTWKSNNPSVASVKDGVITALKTGNATITVKTKDGGYTASCNVTVIQPVISIRLQYTSMTLNAGVSKTVEATVRPITATNKGVKWSSSDKKIATVNKNGKITAKSAGNCVITCKSADGFAKATLKLKVLQQPTGIKLDLSKLKIPVKSTAQLTATVRPKNANTKTVIWATNNSSVATVDGNGKITAVGAGSCTITARTAEGRNSAQCKVTVYIPVKSVKLNVKEAYVEVGDQVVLMPTVKPDNATYKTVKWSSNNKDVATVDKDGFVKAIAPGYAVITAKSQLGEKKAICRINVVRRASGIKINKSYVELDVDETLKLKATVLPSDVSNPAVKWSSSNNSVVKVKSDGTLVGIKKGKAIITAKSADGGYTAKCEVRVLNKVHEIVLSTKKITAYVGEPFTIKATVYPENATNKKITWSSSDQSVCVVSSKGKVTPLKAGTVKIVVKSEQGGIKAKCVVTVEYPPKKVTLSESSLELFVGEKKSLVATVTPENATNKSVTWSSSDTSVAVVNSKGVVTGKSAGVVTVTAVTANGIAKTCKVKVSVRP